ncbi:6-pyruvoyl tetrahydrobiopterin synthase [Pogonomyrmex barbatus]|uniref:6-pyruvoyltetrahydropterin synthase n=1 Tax=Pogonomyrmex barbatus TaxID=144034 RepID=A0A6I9WBE8_9HYME|nr:6-pyruvoyl tetrahydrobiopterin synthase [Pogonomyrmex barbatus]XP_011638021.1 6-pyruvoyl tetrahydrobiopterin synthase [Pogonomyrmex barbatus]XP_011638022.1 6-pyruvoyl tetrahydrobiopterin synthase [Pogonomyrmex barbatus]XP_025074206.1 6-pyruvoyl tetrahydrobiopterin synthase [Pogonomyrmex barbatus]
MDPHYEKRPIAYLTRKEQISCCHRLNSPHLTEYENEKVYGKCNNFWGHGHNYTVEVTVRGPVDPLTGMVMNLKVLKDCMQKVLMDQMDHKNIDKQIDYFTDKVSTTENVAIYIFNELKKLMPKPELLYEVKVHETGKNVMYFRGEYENVSSIS